MQEIEAKKQNKQNQGMSGTRKIVISFFCVIIGGALLLSLNLANSNTPLPFLDNLFVATSATCVTGLVPTVTVEQYSLFGQVVILLMIQIGGLGFLTFLSLLLLKLQKRLSMQSKMVIQEAMNQPSMHDIGKLVKNVIKYTFIVEFIGMVLLSFVFVPEFGWVKGIYFGLFHSVSAFCNAGFDLIGADSMIPYQTNVLINIFVPALIILGGLGFVVWFDMAKKFKKEIKRGNGFEFKHYFNSLELHTKIVTTMTLILLIVAMLIFLICEFNNPNTIGNLSFIDKIQVSYFQSSTLRTAGFATINMVDMYPYTKLVMCLFMFIGGSPAGTAGGIKTVTFAVVCLMVYNIYHGNKEVVTFERRIKKRTIIRSFAIVAIGLVVALSALFVLLITEQLPVIDLIFEAFSAFATVGLSAGVTPLLSSLGKVVVIILMFIGRIGSITLLISFASKSHRNGSKGELRYLDEDVLLG